VKTGASGQRSEMERRDRLGQLLREGERSVKLEFAHPTLAIALSAVSTPPRSTVSGRLEMNNSL